MVEREQRILLRRRRGHLQPKQRNEVANKFSRLRKRFGGGL